MRILVTGEKGKIGLAFRDYLREAHPEEVVELRSVRDNGWERTSFAGYDAVYHCAGLVSGGMPELYGVNAGLTRRLAQKARLEGVLQFIYLSSMAVYGAGPSLGRDGGIVDCGTKPSPVTDYGKSKLMGEREALSLAENGFTVAVVRAPSIFGRGTEGYLDGYFSLMRYGVFPAAFEDCKKSAVYADNLSELVYLIALHRASGIFCPQNLPPYSALEFVRALSDAAGKRLWLSKALGRAIRPLWKVPRVSAIFGRLCYTRERSAAFDHRYAVVDTAEAVRRTVQEGT